MLGSFSVLARDALKPEHFLPDFTAWVSTQSARVLVITRDNFLRAQELNRNESALESALCQLAEDAAGERSRQMGKLRSVAPAARDASSRCVGSLMNCAPFTSVLPSSNTPRTRN